MSETPLDDNGLCLECGQPWTKHVGAVVLLPSGREKEQIEICPDDPLVATNPHYDRPNPTQE